MRSCQAVGALPWVTVLMLPRRTVVTLPPLMPGSSGNPIAPVAPGHGKSAPPGPLDWYCSNRPGRYPPAAMLMAVFGMLTEPLVTLIALPGMAVIVVVVGA